MVFGTCQRLKKLNRPSLCIKNNFVKISNTDSYKYLGLTVSATLNLTEHMQNSTKKATSRLNLLKSMRHLLDLKTANQIYNAMILPILVQYPFATYGSTPQSLKSRISSIESRARNIIGKNSNVPSSDLIRRKRIVSYVHRCLSKDVCENFENYFMVQDLKITTRNSGYMVKVPKVKLEVARKSFYFQGAVIYNELPRDIRIEKNFTKFKSHLKHL